jgi:NADH:ubiquinone oxidoreductase subunit 6 (subunit J)
MTWTAFIKRETDIGIKVTRAEELLRYPLIAALFIFAAMAFAGTGPIQSGEGNDWYPAKMALYAFALVIGLFLRLVMRRWTERFRVLAAGPDAAQEAALAQEIGLARWSAYIYWITIASVCFLGAVKPF